MVVRVPLWIKHCYLCMGGSFEITLSVPLKRGRDTFMHGSNKNIYNPYYYFCGFNNSGDKQIKKRIAPRPCIEKCIWYLTFRVSCCSWCVDQQCTIVDCHILEPGLKMNIWFRTTKLNKIFPRYYTLFSWCTVVLYDLFQIGQLQNIEWKSVSYNAI